jgi:hypothetical protein
VSSRLLHTIVGVGIALGASGCWARSELPDAAGAQAEGGEAGSAGDQATGGTMVGGREGVGGNAGTGGVLGTSGTSGGDPFQGFDPFCDATWPNTKGTPPRPACVDPRSECDPFDWHRCQRVLGPYSCEGWPTEQSPFCIAGTWVCAPGTVSDEYCRCWGRAERGYECTEDGWRPTTNAGEVEP